MYDLEGDLSFLQTPKKFAFHTHSLNFNLVQLPFHSHSHTSVWLILVKIASGRRARFSRMANDSWIDLDFAPPDKSLKLQFTQQRYFSKLWERIKFQHTVGTLTWSWECLGHCANCKRFRFQQQDTLWPPPVVLWLILFSCSNVLRSLVMWMCDLLYTLGTHDTAHQIYMYGWPHFSLF